MTAGLEQLTGFHLGTRTVAFDDRTTILYALCAGATGDDLDLVWEDRLRALPSLTTALGLWAVAAAGELGAYDPTISLHVGQRMRVLRPLPPTGRMDMTGTIRAVTDKGKAAILDIGVSSAYVELGYTIFLPGAGGFGGAPGHTPAPAEPFRPELAVECPTDERLALFYRLTGDRHPVHVDPVTAGRSGFDRPILHGLCTLAIATLAVARLVGAHPCAVSSLDARFAAPVTPGEVITVRASGDRRSARFDALVGDSSVVKDGHLTF